MGERNMCEYMTKEEWTRKLEEGMAALNEKAGIRVSAPIMGQGNFHTNEMPICNRTITKDMIRL